MKAAIDVGTNSVRLLVAEVTPDGLKPVMRENKVTRLGAGVDQSRRLSEEAITCTIRALRDLTIKIPPGVPRIALATSAVRDARNGLSFARLAQEAIGVPLQILSGAREAELSFMGAVFSLRSLDLQGPITMLDIGGGSTEIYTGTPEGQLLGGGSAQVGAVRMLERCGSCASSIEEEIERTLWPLVQETLGHHPANLVAVGGTATSLAAIIQNLDAYSDEAVTGVSFSLEEARDSYAKLGRLSLKERRGLPSLQAGREDVIVPGAAILVKAAELLGFSRLYISAGDLLYGSLISSCINSS